MDSTKNVPDLLKNANEKLEKLRSVNIKEVDNDGRRWIELSGFDHNTNFTFNKSVYGINNDGTLLDDEGYPLQDGDRETIAVTNTLKENEVIDGLIADNEKFYGKLDKIKATITNSTQRKKTKQQVER